MVTWPLIDQFDRQGALDDEHANMQAEMTITRMVQVPNGRGGFTPTPTTLGPFRVGYEPVTSVEMPQMIADQAQGRIAYWLKYDLGIDMVPDDKLTINGKIYTLASEYDPPPNPRVQMGIMWRKQD